MFPRSFSLLCVVMLVGGMALGAVVIETVPVGNPGNTADTRYDSTGYGAVDYAYNIGKYEVTAGQYTEFLNSVAATDIYGLYNTYMWDPHPSYGDRNCRIERMGTLGSYTYSVAADWADRPVNYVSWGDAARFSNWLHNGQPSGAQGDSTTEDGAYDLNGATSDADLLVITRESDATWFIPSEDEWYKAAHHRNDGDSGNYFDYPTGSSTAPGYVNNSGNLSGTGNPFTEGGTDPGNYATYNGDADPDGIGSPYWRTVVGEWENSASPYGTFDQGGNAREWNEAVLLPSYSSRGVRGGSIGHPVTSLHVSNRSHHRPANEDFLIGFRVASSQVIPEPSTFVIWSLLGAAAGFRAWRRRRNR